jgi:polysaccharide export outer membrane protein
VDISQAVVNGDDHILRPGDVLEVKVFQEPDMDSYVRVAKDGAILFPLIDRVTVGGLTPLDAAKLIQRLLDKDYLVNPQVALRVIEYSERTFTVLGEVQKPGAFDMPDRTNVSLLQAIGMAGGYTRMANPSSVTVKRKVKDAETIFRLNAKKMATASGPNSSFEIQPDDVITVSESMF